MLLGRDKNTLAKFEDFVVDRNLPKYKNESNGQEWNTGSIIISGSTGTTSSDSQIWVSPSNSVDRDRFGAISIQNEDGSWTNLTGKRFSWRKRLANRIRSWFNERKKITVQEFFAGLQGNVLDDLSVKDMADYYEKAMQQAKASGQTALMENLADSIEVARAEAILVKAKVNKYVSEGQVIDLYKKTNNLNGKYLKLVWIKNFVRIIPTKVIELKNEVDKLNVFDNYAILHYDPEGTSEQMTKKEKERKKDPILFGMIQNSRKLYYIADWKDEFCDLTLEKMLDTLEEQALTINDKTVKSFIDAGGSVDLESKRKKKPKTKKTKQTVS